MDLSLLGTESVSPGLESLDSYSEAQIVSHMCAENLHAIEIVGKAQPQIASAIEAIVMRVQRGGRVFYVGAGTSGRLGVLDAAEIPPTFSDSDHFHALIAGGQKAIFEAVENAEDDSTAGTQSVRSGQVDGDDVVVGIAASGRTPFVVAALKEARAVGALTVSISCNEHALLSALADYRIELPVGAEMISGSTRLKAGTAQKIVLNMISTTVMIKLGKVYGPYMVGLKATNSKLKKRAIRVLSEIVKTDLATAESTLELSLWRIPEAALMIIGELSVQEAEETLSRAGGNLRHALEKLTADSKRGAKEQ
jgi:N-acetylmuramic acid 6-phosphate etherase